MAKLTNSEKEYLAEKMAIYKTQSKMTDAESLIFEIGNKSDMNDSNVKQLKVLLKAEKLADKLQLQRANARKILNDKKDKERKARTHRMIVLGSALETAMKKDADIASVVKRLFDENYIAEKDVIKMQSILDDADKSVKQLANFHNSQNDAVDNDVMPSFQ